MYINVMSPSGRVHFLCFLSKGDMYVYMYLCIHILYTYTVYLFTYISHESLLVLLMFATNRDTCMYGV